MNMKSGSIARGTKRDKTLKAIRRVIEDNESLCLDSRKDRETLINVLGALLA